MAQARGFMGRVCIDYETTYGVSPTTKAAKALPFNKITLGAKQSLINPSTITNNRNAVKPGMGRITVEGDIEIPADVSAIGYWLKGVFNTAAVTGTNPYTHIFKVSAMQPSLVIEKAFTDIGQYFLYNGCKVNTFKMAFGGDGELVANMSFLGSTETLSGIQYAVPTDVAWDRINNFQGIIKEAGATIATITSGEFSLNCNLDGSQYVVSTNNARGDLPESIFSASGNLKALFTDATLLNKAINGTETSLELIYTSGTKSLSIKFPEVQFERSSPSIDGPAGVGLDLNWTAFNDNDAAGSLCVVTLVNTTSSY